jgi:hypothetical protein
MPTGIINNLGVKMKSFIASVLLVFVSLLSLPSYAANNLTCGNAGEPTHPTATTGWACVYHHDTGSAYEIIWQFPPWLESDGYSPYSYSPSPSEYYALHCIDYDENLQPQYGDHVGPNTIRQPVHVQVKDYFQGYPLYTWHYSHYYYDVTCTSVTPAPPDFDEEDPTWWVWVENPVYNGLWCEIYRYMGGTCNGIYFPPNW